jgi:magnesium-transporting ATPase (P-type)
MCGAEVASLHSRICRGAGIRFFVVTGDHPATAVAIASQAGIILNPAAGHHASDLQDAGAEAAHCALHAVARWRRRVTNDLHTH